MQIAAVGAVSGWCLLPVTCFLAYLECHITDGRSAIICSNAIIFTAFIAISIHILINTGDIPLYISF